MFTYNALIFVIVFGVAILPLKISRIAKCLLALGVGAIAFRLRIFALSTGHPFVPPPIPGWLYLIMAGLLFALIVFALLLIPTGVWRLIRAARGGKWRTFTDRKVDLALFLFSLAISSWGLYNGAKEPVVKSYTVTIPGLPAEAKGFKIAVLTDIHADLRCTADDMRRLVERTNRLAPDAIALLGDNMDGYYLGNNDDLAKKLAELGNLRAKYGVFGVAGNHEYYSGYRDWHGFFLDHQIRMLENAHIDLPCHLTIAGITNNHAEKTGDVVPDAARAISGSRYPAILLSHVPRDAGKNAKLGYILQISGHTHGGLFPGLKKYVADHNDGFVSGWYEVDKMKLYVSDGTGIWGGMPIRFGTTAEITLITLQ